MKKAITKALSVLLVVTILATSLPFSTLAAEENAQNNQTISTDMGDMSITATNSFGEMLTESLSEQTNEQNAGYYISDVEYEGYCALVSFVTQQDCTIRVAVYEEDTGRMVTTASADVLATDTEAIVEFEDELPDYFVLKAFMLDENVAPLCKAYTCNEMTKMYEDFMATTTEDFPEDKVINLDEDETNNFLVMSDDTTTVTTDDKTNVLLSYDSENGIYTFGNIDEQITSLQPDDIFYFDNGNVEELTFIKVGAIDIDGTTAQITEAETSIEEVFDIVKIDNKMTSGEFVVDDDYELEDGVVYEGSEYVELTDDEISTYALTDEITMTKQENYTFTKTIKPSQPKKIGNQASLTGSITITGSAEFSVTGTFKYYVSREFSEIEFTLTPSFHMNITIDGVGRLEIQLKPLTVYSCYGVAIKIRPKFIAEANVIATFDATLKFTIGFGFNTDDGFVDKTSKPSFKPELRIEGSLYIGFDLQPYAYLISEKLVKFKLSNELGAKLTGIIDSENRENHLCAACLDGDIDLIGDLSGELVLGEKTKWEKTYPFSFKSIKIDIAVFYYSFTYKDFGWGECPYTNENTNPDNPDNSGEISYDCDKNGCSYRISAQKAETCTEDGYIQYVCTYCGDTYSETFSAMGHDYQDGVCINCEVFSGKCGDNLTWSFDAHTGTFTISGTGKMYDYYANTRPWKGHSKNIKNLVISNGTTSIGNCAFNGCISLTNVTLGNNVTSIGLYAFQSCVNLKSITIPGSVTEIGYYAFENCTSLKNVTIEDGVAIIGDDAFAKCSSLTSITIPDSVTEIGDNAFRDCTSLSTLTIGNGATSISYCAFNGCISLTNVTLGNNVTSIGLYAFQSCINLKSITIPGSVTEIGYSAFENCTSLTDVYFSGDESQWNEIVIDDYNDPLLNATIHYNSAKATYSLRSNPVNMMAFATTNTNDLTEYNATASNAISGNEYVILVLNSSSNINNFTDEDILYIDQKTAESDSDITFNFVPKSDEECIVYIIGVFSDTNSVKQEQVTPVNPNEPNTPDEPEYNYSFSIQTPSRTEIRHKDGIKLHTNIEGTAPEGSYVKWTANNSKFKTEEINNGNSLKIVSDSNGYTIFTATLYSADGEVLATDTIEMQSKAGFFDKIGSFFRSLFGGTKIYEN